MAEKFRLLVRAKSDGFYGDRKHYSLNGKNRGHKRAGNAFALLADALRYDREGRLEVTKDLKPVLPSWVEPLEEVKPIDPKATPHVVKEVRVKPGKRKPIDAVTQAAPIAWPENMKKHGRKLRSEDDDLREVKIKRAGVPGTMTKNPGSDEDED